MSLRPKYRNQSINIIIIIVQVKSKLQNPTNYHIESVRKNQLHKFLSNQSMSMATQSAPPPSSHLFGGGSPGSNNTTHHGGGIVGSFGVQKDPLLSSGLL